jgi:tetratricopeptide (TPR) repeat protein
MQCSFVRFFTIVLLGAVCCFANKDLAFADSCYKSRAVRAVGDKADKKNAEAMIAAYRRAQKDSTVAEKATEGLVKSLYFSFRFVPFEKNQRKQKLDSLKTISENAYNRYPKNKQISHIYAASISMWGAEKNPLAAVKDGVAAKVRDVATATKNYQVLGRAHQLLPHIPIILSWPDKELADKYLNMALKQDPADLYNYFFLAELRFDQKKYDETQKLIDKGLARGVRKDYVLEDKRARWHLKELQKKLNAKLGK